jgi:hypothetical protein
MFKRWTKQLNIRWWNWKQRLGYDVAGAINGDKNSHDVPFAKTGIVDEKVYGESTGHYLWHGRIIDRTIDALEDFGPDYRTCELWIDQCSAGWFFYFIHEGWRLFVGYEDVICIWNSKESALEWLNENKDLLDTFSWNDDPFTTGKSCVNDYPNT